MEKSKTDVVSIRIDDELKKKLREESELKQVNLNTLINQVLSKHVGWDEVGNKMGWMFLTKRSMGAFLAPLDKNSIISIAETVGKEEFRNSVQFAYGRVDYDSAIRFMETWLQNTETKYSHMYDLNQNKYIIQHEFGKNWSIYFITTLDSLFQDLGFKFTEQIADDLSCSFQIEKVF